MLFSQPIYDDQTRSVLIADDDEYILDLLSQGFEMFGFSVLTTNNGRDAWALFNSEPIDLVLTDIRMPGMDGTELSRRIRKQSPFVTIAVMTGGDTDVATKLMDDGTADYYYPKPFDLISVCESLVKEVQTAGSRQLGLPITLISPSVEHGEWNAAKEK